MRTCDACGFEVQQTHDGGYFTHTSSECISNLKRANTDLVYCLREVREQLGWLNKQKVTASTNVVLVRLDKALAKYAPNKCPHKNIAAGMLVNRCRDCGEFV